jgi:hypothetical protein
MIIWRSDFILCFLSADFGESLEICATTSERGNKINLGENKININLTITNNVVLEMDVNSLKPFLLCCSSLQHLWSLATLF